MSLPLEATMASVDFQRFWTQRRLCVVTTLRPDLTPHCVPMGVAVDFEQHLAWAITRSGSKKHRNIAAAGDSGAQIAVCQVDGRQWVTLEGRADVVVDPDSVRAAERHYAARYKEPRPHPERIALRIKVERILGNVTAAGSS